MPTSLGLLDSCEGRMANLPSVGRSSRTTGGVPASPQSTSLGWQHSGRLSSSDHDEEDQRVVTETPTDHHRVPDLVIAEYRGERVGLSARENDRPRRVENSSRKEQPDRRAAEASDDGGQGDDGQPTQDE